ncbi:MAG TPA: hypothetical protein VHT75_10120 [Acidimicrobiales bacterium]|jgi:hypothetical protein|nr:hypothetical protein [Acidimicrobiales bacterium]
MTMTREKEELVATDLRPSQSVVVDIGGDIGVLVVITDPALDGEEIEICPAGSRARTHTVVRPRALPAGGVVHAGVFPSLLAGDYTLQATGSRPDVRFRVEGGAVTELTW